MKSSKGCDPTSCGPERTTENYRSAVDQLETEQVPDIQGIKFRYFVKKKRWFTYSILNRSIKQFKYTATEASSKPYMAESEIQRINSAITAVFPDLPVAVLNSVVDTLKALGAETTDDLQYITEGDLLPVLKPVQARRLVVSWAQNNSAAPIPTSVCPSPVSICSNPPASSPSPASTTSTSSSPGGSSTFHPDWVDNFQIPWQKLPEELLQSLERQKRPSPQLRREMIRIVASEIMKVCSNPTKRNTTEIGKRMVMSLRVMLLDLDIIHWPSNSKRELTMLNDLTHQR
ncbi:hypothetical protein SRHO_G00126700 [Serrasalmus rhombeus]